MLHAWPGYVAYVVSFLTIGGAWLLHTALTERLTRADPIAGTFATFPARDAGSRPLNRSSRQDRGGLAMSDYLPDVYLGFRERYPGVAQSLDALGTATQEAGGLDA